MAEEVLSIEQFFQKWSKKTLTSIKTLVRQKAYDTGKLFNSIKLGVVKDAEKGYTATLEMIYYGKFVDQGHRLRNGKKWIGVNFTQPLTDLNKIIPNLEKAYSKYLEKTIANDISNINKK